MITKRDVGIAVCLTNGEAIDRAASIDAAACSIDPVCDIEKVTLLELCEQVDSTYKVEDIYKMFKDKFNYNDDQIDNGENIIAIRQKIFK